MNLKCLFVIGIAFAGGVLSSCRKSEVVYDKFIGLDDAESGVYAFSLPLTDSLSAYDFYFYGRTFRYEESSIPLKVRWIAPTGESFTETVCLNNIDSNGRKELYRSGVVPKSRGEWRISVRIEDEGEALLTGIGLLCTQKSHGTR